MTISREENVFYPDRIKYQKKYSNVMDFYALKLRSTSKNLLEDIHSWIFDVRDIWWPQNEYEQGLTHDWFTPRIILFEIHTK